MIAAALQLAALARDGEPAARISGLSWFLFGAAAVVYTGCLAAAGYALVRARRGEPVQQRSASRAVAIAAGATVVILLAFLMVNYATGRAVGRMPGESPVVIEVTGYQWWWKIRYDDPAPSRILTTANEIHIPVGRPIIVKLRAGDVIHSLWIPELLGKRDLIPGRIYETWFRADRPGTYEARCAEFCGHQHANMRLQVVATAPEEFARWYERSLQPASPPTDSVTGAGFDVFMTRTCALCHTVAGTPAGGTTGPDLTHVASRATIAAGTLPNTREHLARWISDPASVKPGARMPATPLTPEELRAVVAWLETLR